MRKNKKFGLQKVINYLSLYVKSENFNKDILTLRKEYKIPKNGLPIKKAKLPSVSLMFNYFPENFISRKDNKEIKKINISINKIINEFPLKNYHIKNSLRFYFFHNKLPKDLENELAREHLCKISDSKAEFYEHGANDNELLLSVFKEHLELENENYPIAIKIHPRTKQADLINFIKQNWNIINHLKKNYDKSDNRLGKIYTRSKQREEIYDLVYKYRNHSLKELIKKVKEKTGKIYGEGEIGKIKSLAIKKRKKV